MAYLLNRDMPTFKYWLSIAMLIVLSTLSLASAAEGTYSGIYVYGAEVRSFRPCNEKTDFWVSFDWAGIAMQDYYKQNKTEPYQEMYVEFRGQVLNERAGGFAEDFDGLIRISEVFKYTFEVPASCR